MDLRRLKAADWATGLFGAALVGLLWAPWFSVAFPFGDVVSGNAWQTMAVNDVIFCIAGLLGVWLAISTAIYSTAAVPLAAAAFATLTGVLASILVVVRLIWPPDLGPGPTARGSGAWLALDAAVGLTVCAALSMRNERRVGIVPVPVTELPSARVREGGSGA